ncbi:tRNA (adenosine(37)-N6)-threonylcarbamoyltransferase complex ATPase subunit type 1 TsaE [Flavobacterium sp. J372]|uniref:tRNA (adenosine(37)-N6)-threonylcarbamoyltransferase complex ATPase subunit type 1 TsaE n=1 Tax=Flavobacterium sp. J372 TaxID=2898436 RepID=UPI0021508D19|nr:tRNA (adenosine(37)-N6)-threonylcarbamoyltransferase complex ATPase subunit type 1 TsaE [Flavobacterium sp. J372]MCR5862351.1 tRNA (adenosine(37)-N6)-threonylcarbamoyltransferase complex ATPase subunit type 1 TsaE [Flavobacterium sp. J372]
MEITFSLEEIDSAAKQILSHNVKKTMLFHAGMGVGKTTLIKAIARQLGVTSMTSSPTFSLVNEYETEAGDTLYHFDLYRLNSETEAYDMGLDEYFYSGNLCLIEWPEKTPNLIPLDHTSITIKQLPDGKRHLTVK